jgi:hypothetical protein
VAEFGVTTYPAALQALLRSPDSNVAKSLAQFGTRVESQAKENASHRPGPEVDTGLLRNSIGWRIEAHDEVELYVGFGAYYGKYLELGWTTSAGNFVQYPFLRPAIESLGGQIGAFSG